MARQHGVVDDTYRRLVIDSGAVYKNYGLGTQLLLGATRGGNVFSIETEYRDMAVDGAKGPVKGSRRITRVMAKLTANFIEFSSSILNLSLPGSSTSALANHTSVTRSLQIALTDYSTNIALVGEVSGAPSYPIICILSNPIVDSNIEINMTDNEEAVYTVTFTAHFDPDTLDTEPWEIRWPDVTTVD